MATKTYLSLVEDCDNFPYDSNPAETHYQLFLPGDDRPHGYMLPEVAAKMPWTSQFRVQHSRPRSVTVLDASGGRDTCAAVNAAFQDLVDICVRDDLFLVLDGKHSEPFAITSAKYPAIIERFASSLFGTISQGAHLIAYCHTPAAGLQLWIQRRAAHLWSGPGLLDATVAGGVKGGVSPLETIIQEGDEEASLPEALMREHVRSRGVLTYISVTGGDFRGEKGLVFPDVVYAYDMELPAGVVPEPKDGEVEGFYLMTVDQVRAAMFNGEFKADAAALVIDFFIRQGIITADNEKDFVEINMRLHRRLPFLVSEGSS